MDNRRDIDRGIADALRYYGGPLGEKVISLAQVADLFNPVSAVRDAGASMREGDYVGAVTDTAAALVPVVGARAAMRAARGVPSLMSRQYDEATSGVVEALTGSTARQPATPPRVKSNTDMSRRQFLGGMAAAGGMAAMGPELLQRVAPDVLRQSANPIRNIAATIAAKNKALGQLSNRQFEIATQLGTWTGGPKNLSPSEVKALQEEEKALNIQLQRLQEELTKAGRSFAHLADEDPQSFTTALDDVLQNLDDLPKDEQAEIANMDYYIRRSIQQDIEDIYQDESFLEQYGDEIEYSLYNSPIEDIDEEWRNRVQALDSLRHPDVAEVLDRVARDIPF